MKRVHILRDLFIKNKDRNDENYIVLPYRRRIVIISWTITFTRIHRMSHVEFPVAQNIIRIFPM